MEIGNLPKTEGAAGLSAASSAPSDDTGVISSDFETFLVMLTAQIQNQDPLNPMDSSDYAVQLATFSGVEQQVLTNELLRELSPSDVGPGLGSMASWVGLETRVSGMAKFEGDPVQFEVAVPRNSVWAKLYVYDTAGHEIASVAAQPGRNSVTWDGTKTSGGTARNGDYVATLEYYTGGEAAPQRVEVNSSTFVPIVEVRQSAGGAEVVLENGQVLAAADVDSLRSPQ